MKTLKKSFLFLFLCTLLVLNKLHSQIQIIDSLDYYKEVYNNPKVAGDEINAFKYFQNRMLLLKENRDALLETEILIMVAQIEKKLGFLIDSENTVVKALELLPEIKDNDSIVSKRYVSIYNHLGKIYREYGDYSTALVYYDGANSRAYNLKDSITIINNRGYLYLEQGRYDLAIEKFKKAYNKSLEIGDSIQEARALDNLGVVQSKIGDSNALFNLIKALEIRKKKNYANGIISSYIRLGEYHKERNEDSIANEYVNEASKVSDTTDNILHKQAVFSLKMKLKNDAIYNELVLINDSINNSKKSSSVKYAKLKYDKSEEERKAVESELKFKKSEIKREREEFNKILVGAIGGFIFVLSIFLYFILKSKHKKKTLQAVYNTESHISKKVHDEVANDVFQVMTTLQGNANVKEKVIDDLDHIYSKTRNIAKVHSVLDYEGDFKDTLNDLLLSYDNEMTRVIVKDVAKINWGAISKMKKQTIYKVLQELMVNMKKHSEAEIVALTFKTIKKKVTITYSDDGVGTNLKKSTGLQNVENRIKSIKGTIIFESEINKGFKSKITV